MDHGQEPHPYNSNALKYCSLRGGGGDIHAKDKDKNAH